MGEIDARFLAPEQIGADSDEAICGKFIAPLAHVRVYTKYFVQNDNCGSRQGMRPRDIGAKRAVPAFEGDAIFHWVLLNRHIHLCLRRCRQDRRRHIIGRGGFSRPARAGLTKRHFTLLPWLRERLLPLFGSHRARVAAATAWPRGCSSPQRSWHPCAWRGSVPGRDGRCDPRWQRWTSSASTSMR